MASKKVMIEELSKDMFVIKHNSPLIKMIEFSFILHSFLIESEISEDNEWYDFIFGVNLKIVDSNDEIIIFNSLEVKNIINWLDWICRLLLISKGKHNESVFVKSFISKCDSLFKKFNYLNHTEEKVKKLKDSRK